MPKITDLQRSENSARTEFAVSATVADLQTLTNLIVCATATSGKLKNHLVAKMGALYVVFAFDNYQAHHDFYAICLSLRN
jgi:hypothetical protein